ncbi:MAG TPA: hypothetical protein VHV81_13435 [Steroidobacteraceae bacterium]|nr:hypothetical protein [Steroidobacteraceae bacterium]
MELPQEQIAEARHLLAELKIEEGEAVLTRLIDAPGFARLPSATRYDALALGVNGWLSARKYQLAYGYSSRMVMLPECTYDDAVLGVRIALAASLKPDAVNEMTAVVRRWPGRVGGTDPRLMSSVLRAGYKLPHGATLPLLQALYAAHWKVDGEMEPSGAWRDLTLLLLEKEDPSAADVAARVTDPYVLIGMRSDKRFDGVIARAPERFDVDAAVALEARQADALAAGSPRSLRLRTLPIETLRRRRRYREMVAALDSLLAEIRSSDHPQERYADFGAQYAWVLNERARALEHLGRYDEAVTQLTEATGSPEDGQKNVSQMINLAHLYCRLGRPQEALDTIRRLEATPSDYGLMEEELVRLRAAVELGDSAQTDRSLDYMNRHHADAEIVYSYALVIANHLDEAAEAIKRVLRDPDLRDSELLDLQHYGSKPQTPAAQREIEARIRSVNERPDVRAEIDKVGRVATYDIPSADW